MLGPVMNSGSTGNADTSPAGDAMQPDWGLYRSVLPMMHSSRNDGGFYDEDRL